MQRYTDAQLAENRLYLEALALQYPTVRTAAAEIMSFNSSYV